MPMTIYVNTEVMTTMLVLSSKIEGNHHQQWDRELMYIISSNTRRKIICAGRTFGLQKTHPYSRVDKSKKAKRYEVEEHIEANIPK